MQSRKDLEPLDEEENNPLKLRKLGTFIFSLGNYVGSLILIHRALVDFSHSSGGSFSSLRTRCVIPLVCADLEEDSNN